MCQTHRVKSGHVPGGMAVRALRKEVEAANQSKRTQQSLDGDKARPERENKQTGSGGGGIA
jgi:hypothetical protein